MATLEKSRLRNSLRKMRTIASTLDTGVDRIEVAQEMLDLAAVQAGLKPVFLLGRGLDDPKWIDGVLALARELRLRVVEGPYWDATPFGDDIPRWYADHTRDELALLRGWYLCRTRAVELALQKVRDAGGRLTMTEEATLLGYPECCVAAHYRRALAYHRAVLSILGRRAEGDEDRMQSLFIGKARLIPESDAEKAAFDSAMVVVPAPFGSWNMCGLCAGSGDSPSARLSGRYRTLAETIDPDWVSGLASSYEPPPRSMS